MTTKTSDPKSTVVIMVLQNNTTVIPLLHMEITDIVVRKIIGLYAQRKHLIDVI